MNACKVYRFLPLLLILGWASGMRAQTPVTGHVIGPNSVATMNQAYVQFRLQNFSGNIPRLNAPRGTCSAGAVLPTVTRATPDATGTFSLTICGNDVITPQSCGPSGAAPCTYYTVEYFFQGLLQYLSLIHI